MQTAYSDFHPELELTFEAEEFEEYEDNAEFEEGSEFEEEGDYQWPKTTRFRGPAPGTIPVGPPTFQLPICRAAYGDLGDLVVHVGALKRAHARKPIDRHRVHNARLDLSRAVDQMIDKLRRGHYARASCGRRDFAGLKERLKRLRLGLPERDRNVLDRVVFFARAAGRP
jgi:hypothetical protein